MHNQSMCGYNDIFPHYVEVNTEGNMPEKRRYGSTLQEDDGYNKSKKSILPRELHLYLTRQEKRWDKKRMLDELVDKPENTFHIVYTAVFPRRGTSPFVSFRDRSERPPEFFIV